MIGRCAAANISEITDTSAEPDPYDQHMGTPAGRQRPVDERGDGVATIVFADVEGSTALVEKVGDATGTVALLRQLDVVRERLDSYGGREVKSLGDGLMLSFASPRAALSFALATQRALGPHLPRVRIGINSGEVVDGDRDPMGATVNAAARICARAKGGEVLLADVVRLLAGNMTSVRFHDRGRVRLKGFSEQWHLWAAEDGAPPAPQQTTIGRERERHAVEELLASTLSGAGGTVLLEGEAGIGKSHLLIGAAEQAHHLGMLVVKATADEMANRTGLVLHAIAGQRGVRGRTLADLLDSTLGAGASDLSFAAVEAGIEAVEHLTRDRPTLIVVDDAQWLDELSLAALRAIARRAAALPVGIVVAFRPTPQSLSLDRLIDTVADLRCSHLRVGPLDDIDIQALAAAVTGAAPGTGLRKRLDSTAGNPLFVTELLRLLDDDGQLEIAGGVADVDSAVIPTALNETLVRRLGWLARETIDLLRLASLLGTSFTLADVAVITGRSVVDVAAGLREASTGGIISGAGDRLRFRHDLIREAVYGNMAPAERRDLHAAAGHSLAASGAPTQRVADQFARGALPGDLDAVDWLQRAADEVVSISPGSGLDLYEQALALAPELWPGRAAILARMVEPLAWCGRFDEAQGASDAVLASSSQDALVFEALKGASAIHGNRGDIAAAIAAIQRAVEHPGAPPDEQAWLNCFAAQLQMQTGEITAEQANQIAQQMLEQAVADDDATGQCIAYQVLGTVSSFTGYGEESARHTRRAADLFESGRVRPTSYLIPDMFHAGELVDLDRFDEALEASAKARKDYARRGALTQLPVGYVIPAAAHVYCGAHDEAEAEIEAGMAVIEDTGSRNFLLYFHALRSRIALRQGDAERAAGEVEQGTEILASGGPLFGADWLLDAQVQCLVGAGDDQAALALAELVWEQTAFMRFFHGGMERGVALVRLATSNGRPDLARTVTAEVQEMARRRPTETTAGAALWCSALLDADPTQLERAVERYRSTLRRPALALCCEDLAGLVATSPEAMSALGEAAAIHTDIGSSGDLARVEAELHARGSISKSVRSPRPTFGWDSLTPTELCVTELVAEGLSNPEVGARLFISRRTVETHLSHVFRKVDCTSRTQVAAEFLRRGSNPAGRPGGSG